MERPLIRGVAPQMRDQAAYLTLGGGAGGRSLGSIFCITLIAALYLWPLCRSVSVLAQGWARPGCAAMPLAEPLARFKSLSTANSKGVPKPGPLLNLVAGVGFEPTTFRL